MTIVTESRKPRLSEVADGQVLVSAIGKIVETCWQTLPAHFPVILDAFVIMPNHLHGIILIEDTHNRRGEASGSKPIFGNNASHPDASPIAAHPPIPSQPHGAAPGSLGAIILNFKSISTRKVNAFHHTPTAALWQRNYYEHVIRSERDLETIRDYIHGNPIQWELDPENPFKKK